MEKKDKSTSWVDDFSKGSFSLFSGNSIDNFQPLDFYHFYPMWYDLWIKKIANIIQELDLDNKIFKETKHLFPTPSSIRAVLIKLFTTYQCFNGNQRKANKESFLITACALADKLEEGLSPDPFAFKSNILHSKKEIESILESSSIKKASPEVAKSLGRFLAATGSLVHGIYNDVVTDFGWDVYGPYKLGNDRVLLIRHFPNLRPRELWPASFLPKNKELVIYMIYEGVEFEIQSVGCHTVIKKGDPISGLKKFSVLLDGQAINIEKIKDRTENFARLAVELYKHIYSLNFEQLKEMVMYQECFQLKGMCDKAGIDWRPSKKMLLRVKNKKIPDGILPTRMMKTIEEYRKCFGIDDFKKEVLDKKDLS